MTREMKKSFFFLGAGGIGMSALERYFNTQGCFVAGYDRTPSELTDALEAEGICLHFEDNPELIPDACRDAQNTIVVYTPAIPADSRELAWFRERGFEVMKRAAVLGLLTREKRGLCAAGTHGKTTTSAMTAHLLRESKGGCSAFLGGIAKNYGTNCLIDAQSDYVVIEADEFDRSFHQLRPYATVVTSADADHLDIYGTEEAYLESFSHYTSLIQPGGALIVHRGLRFEERLQEGVRRYDYSRTEGDFHAENIRIGGGRIVFDFVSPFGNIADIELGVPVSINIDNGIAAMALAQLAGADAETIRRAMATYSGVVRRFDFKIRRDDLVFLSDYAHHPAEIRQSILSLREVFDGRRVAAIFQPHLYTRTRDFYPDFADALSLLDEVILLDIYPAREEPIAGVTSQLIYDRLRPEMKKTMTEKAKLLDLVRERAADFDVLVVLGAGDADNLCPEITDILLAR
ncbi:MAG: UDP-N-acetylmuramate--L-alanine ligase [Alloprevotella sp.]